MADQLRASNRKRALRNEQKPMAKRQKREKSDESINDEEEGPITNICPEMIGRILDFLDIGSLLNVADTCKRLQIAAVAKYGHKFGRNSVKLCSLGTATCDRDIRDDGRGQISVDSLNNCLKFLRCFGAKISKLKVFHWYKNENAFKSDKYVDQYIYQYCADTLPELDFMGRAFSNNSFSKETCKNVTKLQLESCVLGNQLPSIAKAFPNVRELLIGFNTKIVDTAVSFPHVDNLTVFLYSKSGRLNANCATKLLHANPQIKTLKIVLAYKKNLGQLLAMVDKNPFLSKLYICGKFNGVNAAALNRFMKKHQLLEELAFSEDISVDDAVILSRQLSSLKSLEFQLEYRTEYDSFLTQLDSHWQHSVLL